MCARILMCPLCSQPGFLTLDALRAGLISVATQPLICPVCNEVLLGIDKLTIHLFSHTINLSNNTADGLKQTENITDHNSADIIHDSQNNAVQEWNVPKIQITQIAKLPANIGASQQNVNSCKNISHIENKLSTLNSEICDQDRNLSSKNETHVMFLSEKIDDERRLNIFQKPVENGMIMLEPAKCSKGVLPQTLTLSIDIPYSCSNNPINVLQNNDQTLHKNVEFNKHIWMQNAHCKQQVVHETEKSTDINKIEKVSNEITERCNNRQNIESPSTITSINKECDFENFQTFGNITLENCKTPIEALCNEKNPCKSKENLPNNRIQCQDERINHKKILPNLRAFNILAAKERTERCNICGFHFPNHDILILHKQLVHMIDEKNLSNTPENFLKHYSCHLCSKVFKMRGSLMVHMRVAHVGYNLGNLAKDGQEEPIFSESGYNCPTCGKKFKKEQHVIQHLKTHEAKQWECDEKSHLPVKLVSDITTRFALTNHRGNAFVNVFHIWCIVESIQALCLINVQLAEKALDTR
ncbi:hypothetical protein KM043_009825 [Ampulex compressa]|nr:hypothetical protein KM043_009825 [Ampulex compressa]